MDDGLMDIHGLQLLGANRRVSKQKVVEVSETVGWRGTHSLTAQVGGGKTSRMEDPAQQTEQEGSYLYLAICLTCYILRNTEIGAPRSCNVCFPLCRRINSHGTKIAISNQDTEEKAFLVAKGFCSEGHHLKSGRWSLSLEPHQLFVVHRPREGGYFSSWNQRVAYPCADVILFYRKT